MRQVARGVRSERARGSEPIPLLRRGRGDCSSVGLLATAATTHGGLVDTQIGPCIPAGSVGRRGTIHDRVRPCETSGLGDQLGLVRRRTSKIEDGSDMGTLHTEVTSVSDFRLPSLVDPPIQLILSRRPILGAEVIGSACCRRLSRLPPSSP
jgi:hypothetical protein